MNEAMSLGKQLTGYNTYILLSTAQQAVLHTHTHTIGSLMGQGRDNEHEGGGVVTWLSRDGCHGNGPAGHRQAVLCLFNATTNYPWLTGLGRLGHPIASVYCTHHGKFRTESVSGQEAICFRT